MSDVVIFEKEAKTGLLQLFHKTNLHALNASRATFIQSHPLYPFTYQLCLCTFFLSRQTSLVVTSLSQPFTFPVLQMHSNSEKLWRTEGFHECLLVTLLLVHTILGCSLVTWYASCIKRCTCWLQSVVQNSIPSLLSPLENVRPQKMFPQRAMFGGCGTQAHSNYYNICYFLSEKLLVEGGWERGLPHPSNLCSAGYMLSNYDYSGERNRRRQLQC